ncbi:MAG: hypothetical protein ACOX0T_02180 [Pelotomaculum sp.]
MKDKAPQSVAELFKLSDAPIIQSTQAIKQEMYDSDLYSGYAGLFTGT